jgi:transcriptional/translational regulatory protein YebC/TACO1
MNKQELLKRIGAIGKAAKVLTANVQEVAVACVWHAALHGDVTLADQLVDAIGKGMRRASLRAWFEMNGCMILPRGKDKFAFDKERAAKLKEEGEKEVCERLMALPWEDAKPEEKVVSVLDVEVAFDKFMARLGKEMTAEGLTVQNKDLYEVLTRAAAVHMAKKILGESAGHPVDHETGAIPQQDADPAELARRARFDAGLAAGAAAKAKKAEQQ